MSNFILTFSLIVILMGMKFAIQPYVLNVTSTLCTQCYVPIGFALMKMGDYHWI